MAIYSIDGKYEKSKYYNIGRSSDMTICLCSSDQAFNEFNFKIYGKKQDMRVSAYCDYCPSKPKHGPRIKVKHNGNIGSLAILPNGGIELSVSELSALKGNNKYGDILDIVGAFSISAFIVGNDKDDIIYTWKTIYDGHYGEISYEEFINNMNFAETEFAKLTKSQKIDLIMAARKLEKGNR